MDTKSPTPRLLALWTAYTKLSVREVYYPREDDELGDEEAFQNIRTFRSLPSLNV